jgi:DNA-binding response OmpR family regulator
MRPELRRTYVPEPLLAGAEGGCALTLGYAPLPGEARGLDASQRSLYNDFGPGSIDGWLADLAARELLVEDAGAVDSVRRELRLDGERIDLTQLEFDVLRYLQQREGEAVQREALLRDVWGYEWTGGSNVVEVAISTLRKKLGERARALRTVRGIGYRLDPLT